MIKFRNVYLDQNTFEELSLSKIRYFDGENYNEADAYSGNNGKLYESEQEALIERKKYCGEEECEVNGGNLDTFLNSEIDLSKDEWIDFLSCMLFNLDDYFSFFVNENNEKIYIVEDDENIEAFLTEFNEFYNVDIRLEDIKE